jgi:hypothetical protein
MKSLLSKRIAAKKIGNLDPQASKQTLEDTAATTISSIFRGHKGRAKTARLKSFKIQ